MKKICSGVVGFILLCTIFFVAPVRALAQSNALVDIALDSGTLTLSSVSYVVRNSGTASFTGRFVATQTWIRADGTEISSNTDTYYSVGVLTLTPGDSYTRTFSADFFSQQPQDAARLRVSITPSLVSGVPVSEGTTTNNTFEIPVVRTTHLDFAIQSPELTPTRLTYRLLNVGDAYYGGPFNTTYTWLRADETIVSSTTRTSPLSLFSAGSSSTVTVADGFIVLRPADATKLRITVNGAGAGHIPETNDANNTVDTEPTTLDFQVDSPILTATTAQFIVRNIGTQAFSGQPLVYVYTWLDSRGNSLLTSAVLSQSIVLPAGASSTISDSRDFITHPPAGASRLRVEVNPSSAYGAVGEVSHANNTVEFSFPTVDFAVDQAVLSGPTVSFRLTNIGQGVFSDRVERTYTWLGGDGLEISSTTASGIITLSGGTSTTVSYTNVFIASPPSLGRQLRVSVNQNHAVAEGNYSNNTATVDRLLPDLLITTSTLTATDVTYTIRNAGTVGYSGLLTRSFRWLDSAGVVLSSTTVRGTVSLTPGGSVSRTYTSTSGDTFLPQPPAGAIGFRIVLDPDNVIAELHEDNNAIDMPPRFPDFQIASAHFTASGLDYTIANSAGGDFHATLQTAFLWQNASGTTISSTTISSFTSIPTGGTLARSQHTFVSAPPDAASQLRVVVNPSGRIRENNFDNNAFVVARALPDVVVEGLSLNLPRLSYTIRNIGDGAQSGVLQKSLQWIDTNGVVLASTTEGGFVSLAPGASVAITRSGSFINTPPPAARLLRITLDPQARIAQRNRANDSADVAISILAPDLAISGATSTRFGIEYTLRNMAPGSFSNIVPVFFSWLSSDNRTLSSSSFSGYLSLSSGSSTLYRKTGPFFNAPPAAATRLHIVVDPNHTLSETNYDNNVSDVILPAAVTTPPDFTITSGSVSGPTATYTVQNSGGNFEGMLYRAHEWVRADGSVISSSTVGGVVSLPAGASRSLVYTGVFIATAPADAALLRVTVNPGGIFAREVYQLNNTFDIPRAVSSTPHQNSPSAASSAPRTSASTTFPYPTIPFKNSVSSSGRVRTPSGAPSFPRTVQRFPTSTLFHSSSLRRFSTSTPQFLKNFPPRHNNVPGGKIR